jgi:penicillin-binding protein 2
MSVFNQSRKNVIALVFVLLFVIIILRLGQLQLFSGSSLAADALAQGTVRKVIYPQRGIIYGKGKKAILENTTTYDLMVTPNRLKGIDTFKLCNILGIDTAKFKKKLVEVIVKNGRTRESIFESMLSQETMAMLAESMYMFEPGFFLQERSVRRFPYDAGANIFGYIKEVDPKYLAKHPEEGYAPGDYIGKSGLEKSYEKTLMGQRGIEYWKRDNKNRLTEKLDGGKYDTVPIAGQNLYTSVDMELQELGEKLMENKLGSIVALDPKTGSVLAMVSAPSYKPSFITGEDNRKHYSELLLDPRLPTLNRAVNGSYAPGSTFKTLQALIGLQEQVITTDFTVSCNGAFRACGGRPMGCLDYGTFDLHHAITVSDNTYFATVMRRVVENPKFPTVDSSLNNWVRYMNAFGLGKKLGIDVPTEQSGFIPGANYYNKRYGPGKWNFCTIKANSIGQGEITTTPIQTANEMAYIANRGWFYTPHVVDSIEGGDKLGVLDKYKIKNKPLTIADSIFEAVHDGMEDVITRGTGKNARVKGIRICGKTGTVENYYRGKKQENHSFFCAFAPREDPKIAIMCVVENSGRFGGTYAAPIVGLMIEKYLKDSITDKGRKAQIERLSNTKLIPKRIFAQYRIRDSIIHAGDSAYLIAKGFIKIIKDTSGIDEDEDDKEEAEKLVNSKGKNAVADEDEKKDDKKKNKEKPKVEALNPLDEKKKQTEEDTATKNN